MLDDWVVREDPPEETELAVRHVRQYQRRSPTGKPEVVSSYQAQRAWWIPHPDWEKGQQEWITAGEHGWQQAGARNRAAERAEPPSPGAAAEAGQDREQAGRRAAEPEESVSGRPGPAGRAKQAAEQTLAQRPEHGYLRPDPDRLARERGTYKRPEDHPFFQRNPLSADNIVRAYDQSTPSERYQGMRWYEDAHRVAWALGGGDTAKGAAVLAAYSPQTAWPVNLFNAARSLAEGRAYGPGEAMATGAMQKSAQRLINGEHPEDVLASPKVNAFGRLIALGRDHPEDELGQVVVDRHAMSVAAGKRLLKEDVNGKGERASPIGKDPFYSHVADMYREAAYRLSQREGEEIAPHQLQAVTWLYQQRMNAADDATRKGGTGKGLITGMRNAWARWEEYAREHGLSTSLGTTAASPLPITEAEARGNSRAVPAEEFYQLASQGKNMLAQMRDAKSAISGLAGKWQQIKAEAWKEVQKPWGGMTVDAHTGRALPDGADKYALSVKPPGIDTISVPEGAGEAAFMAAMDEALVKFRVLLEHKGSYLGIFHDDNNHRIDIDPVTVVGSTHEVEAIGAYTHNIGGAYHFKTGNGHFPPHIQGEK